MGERIKRPLLMNARSGTNPGTLEETLMSIVDPISLAQDLIRCPSVTPEDAGALDVLQKALEGLGFRVRRCRFEEEGFAPVDNLYARLGSTRPNFCFAGHTDVVPVGDDAAWSVDPFAAVIEGGNLYGRGACDMKTAIAAFVAAVSRFTGGGDDFTGAISLLITGDEEGPSVNGTRKLLQAITEKGEVLDHCLVGEPTNPNVLGEMAKIGRRGSINGVLTVHGAQGHAAYPHLADNPVPKLVRLLAALDGYEIDDGNDYFQSSNLEITTVDVGNTAENVIPARASAGFNVRFNDDHTSASMEADLRGVLNDVGEDYELGVHVSGEPFLSEPGRLSALLSDAVEAATGRTPDLSTTGGTSDARFIKDYCPVIEFGMVGQSMHKVDEHCAVADIEALSDIYEQVLMGYFASS